MRVLDIAVGDDNYHAELWRRGKGKDVAHWIGQTPHETPDGALLQVRPQMLELAVGAMNGLYFLVASGWTPKFGLSLN